MRILIATHSLTVPAGSETYALTLAHTLRSLGHDVICFSPRLGRMAEELRRHGIATVADAREAGTVDVIHSSHLDSTHLALAAMPVTPVVFVQHGAGTREVLERPPKPRQSIERWVAVSEVVAETLAWRDGVPRDQIHVIPNFVDLESFAPLYPPRTPPNTVLFLSNFQPPEMRQLVIDACQLAGMTPRFAGGRRRTLDIRSELMVADIVVTIGRGAIEAMACGRPVVLLSGAGGDGLLTPAMAPAALASNYSGLVRRTVPGVKELAAELLQVTPALGEWGRTWAQQHHDARTLVPRLVELYEDAVVASRERLQREGLAAILASRYEEFYPALRWYFEVPMSFDSLRASLTFPVWAPDADDEIELMLERHRDEIAMLRQRYEWLVGYRPIGLLLEAARFVRRSMRGRKRT